MKVKKFSKFLSLLLALVLVVGLLPVTALAASVSVADAAELADALTGAADGDTITLTADITGGVSYVGESGKTVTIDGGSHKITADAAAGGLSTALTLSGGGTIILKNITLQGNTGSSSYGLYIYAGSTINVQSVGTVSAIGGDNATDDSFGLYHYGSGTVRISAAQGGSGLAGSSSCGIRNGVAGTVYADTATGGTAGSSIGVHNVGTGIVNVGTASGGSAAIYSFGVYNREGGTVNAVSAAGGSAAQTNASSYGVWNASGTVNVATASGGEAFSSYGVNNYGGTVNATAANGGSHATNVYESYGVYNSADQGGTINVTTASGGTASNYSYGAGNIGDGGVINVQTATSAAAATGNGDTVGNSVHTGAGVATLTLNRGAGASCVLDSITVAGLGATEIGVLPLVSKDGTEGTWYTDEELNSKVADSSVNGVSALYSNFYVKATVPVLSSGSVSRTSDTAATISFTTDEAGTAYYSVVDKDSTAPEKEAVAAGTSLGSVSGTVADKAITLTAGAKDIYVVVKNASDNISNPLKIAAEAYVSPAETLANTLNNAGITASASGSTVTVTGTRVATDTLALSIPAGVKVLWNASLTGAIDGPLSSLVFLNGDGTFELAGGEITNTGTGMAVVGTQGSLVISGGTASSSSDVATVNSFHTGQNAMTLTMTGGTVRSTSTSVSSSAISAGGNTVITGGTITAASGNQVFLNNAVVVYRSDLLTKIASNSLSASIAVDPSKTYATPTETEGLTATGYSATTGNVTAHWAVLYSGEGTGVWVDYTYSGTGSGSWRVSYPAVQVVSGRHSLTYRANGGTGAATPENTVYKGQSYTVSANVFTRTNYTFTGWNTEADGTGTPYAAGATLIGGPGSDDIILYAQWSPTGSGSNPGSGGGGGSNAPTTPTPTVSGTTVTTTVTPTVKNGAATGSVTESQMSDALKKAQAAAGANGTPNVTIQIGGASGATSVGTTVPHASMKALASGGGGALTISGPTGSVSFDAAALKTISGATGDVTVTVAKTNNSALPEAAKAIVGSHPVFTFSVTSGGSTVSQFGGDVTVSVPYTPASGEDTNAIVIYYIAADGTPTLVPDARYDAATGTVIFTTTHFSTYAVGYNKLSFTDVSATAWYADAVTFLSARGITSGTTATTFCPDATLTRGQFVTMLLRAYGIEPDNSSTDNFSDAGDTYYTGYLAAAKKIGITSGVGDNKFAPDMAITRQEMFTLLYNALKVLDKLPSGTSGKTLSDFTDSGSVASWATGAMTALVKAGTVSGSGGKLSPAASTTRAEMAQVLYNLLEK